MLIPLAMLFAGQTSPEFVPNAKLGTPYLLGAKQYVSGSKEVIDTGTERWVTIHSVRTALAFGTKGEIFVANAGQKLILLTCTMKNPSKVNQPLGASDTFGIRIFDKGAVAGDYHYERAVSPTGADFGGQLKKGESADFIVIMRGPAHLSTLRLGIYYRRDAIGNMRRYDLTPAVPKPNSVFSTDGLVWSKSAEVGLNRAFELDQVVGTVTGFRKGAEANQYVAEVQITNPHPIPAKWGWQYASAKLTTSSGESISFYPEFVDQATGMAWSGDVPPGATIKGEYRFYPGKTIDAESLTIATSSTQRTVNVKL